jgi:hypothetical protein
MDFGEKRIYLRAKVYASFESGIIRKYKEMGEISSVRKSGHLGH